MLSRKRNEQAPRNAETSLIAHGTTIRGDVRFSGTLHLDGRIEGCVLGEGPNALFTLSEHGHVQGEVRVPHAMINGQVTGDIYASERLELAAQARVTGDVRYNSLEMTSGAQVNGRMAHQGEGHVQRELPAPEMRPEPATA
ncbi:polymer-forming cytoskeletal protein [Dyella flava]|uniref:Polymer-forming cytoskeletal protein n=1 Tax=Dyella flava TaxID=1920170 RepID=A0ABS2JZD8_9GAMM|nr:polymer-forming cytoskeletal protein [Dyella flava]MBM7124365.1 polymer-forming cytoskeletal protein [Dyella flava]GLQ52451.1 cell shape determination protein CcmA [Dyella flava]